MFYKRDTTLELRYLAVNVFCGRDTNLRSQSAHSLAIKGQHGLKERPSIPTLSPLKSIILSVRKLKENGSLNSYSWSVKRFGYCFA